jgi:transposase
VTTIDEEAVLKRMTDRKVTVGIDTHKHIHVAVALSEHGQRLGDLTVAADPGGYEQLLSWARSFGEPWCFGVEGCGSYGQGLVGFLRRHDQRVVEAPVVLTAVIGVSVARATQLTLKMLPARFSPGPRPESPRLQTAPAR